MRAIFLLLIFAAMLEMAGAEDFSSTGGTDVGRGGNTRGRETATIEDVLQAVGDAKPKVTAFFYSQENRYLHDVDKGAKFDGSEKSWIPKLFGVGEKNVFEVFEDGGFSIEVRKSKPCLDRQGHEVDASILATKGRTICLSARNLVELRRFTKAELSMQVEALIAHEISHLFGSTEAEAGALQETFFLGSDHHPASSWMSDFFLDTLQHHADLEKMTNDTYLHSWIMEISAISATRDLHIRDMSYSVSPPDFSFSRIKVRGVKDSEITLRLYLLNLYFCSKSRIESRVDRDTCRTAYAAMFDANRETSLLDLVPKFEVESVIRLESRAAYRKIKFKRILSHRDALAEIALLQVDLDRYVDEVKKLARQKFSIAVD